MIKFDEAVGTVLRNPLTLNKKSVSIAECSGLVLSQAVFSDRDIPPFNKSAVDGYAFRIEDVEKNLKICELIQAGAMPERETGKGECSKIMTGAMVPDGADCVVMIEETSSDGNSVKIVPQEKILKKWSNICLKGEDAREGTELLAKGTILNASHIAVLASAGVASPIVSTSPVVGIICTGNEIVEPRATPELYQIRNSNGWQLLAQTSESKAESKYYGIVADNKELLLKAIVKATEECDIMLITGGVSMGEFDYVPFVLKEAGYTILFDRIAVQPGKPTTFAVIKNGEKTTKAVFALPGNPVSSYIQFEMLVKPYIYKCMGADYSPLKLKLKSSELIERKRADRMAFIPVKLSKEGTFSRVNYNGSAHISAITGSDGIAVIQEGQYEISENELSTVYLFS